MGDKPEVALSSEFVRSSAHGFLILEVRLKLQNGQ